MEIGTFDPGVRGTTGTASTVSRVGEHVRTVERGLTDPFLHVYTFRIETKAVYR